MTPEQDRRAGRTAFRVLLVIAVFGIGIIGAAMITAHWFPSGDEPAGFVLMGVLMIALTAGLYWSVKRMLFSPGRDIEEPSGLAAGHRPTRAPIPIPPVMPQQQGGCLALLGGFIVTVGAGIATAVGTYRLLNMIVAQVAPGSSAAYNISIGGAMIACLAVTFVLDRWFEKRTGSTILQSLAHLSWL